MSRSDRTWKLTANSHILLAFGFGFLFSQGLHWLWQWQTRPQPAANERVPFALPDPLESAFVACQRRQETRSRTDNDTAGALSAFDVLTQHAYRALTTTTTTTTRATTMADSSSTPPRPQSTSGTAVNWAQWPHRSQGGLLDPDRHMLERIYRNANSIFEWGLGESTHIAAAVGGGGGGGGGVTRYVGIDSDPLYVQDTRTAVQQRHAAAAHFRFLLGDVGPTRDWGFPETPLPKNVWTYQIAPLASEPAAFDVYFVDGRYRVACLLAAFLHASSRGSSFTGTTAPDTVVLVHDCDRAGYHIVDPLLIKHESGGLLCHYTRRKDTSDAQLLALWMKHFVNVAR